MVGPPLAIRQWPPGFAEEEYRNRPYPRQRDQTLGRPGNTTQLSVLNDRPAVRAVTSGRAVRFPPLKAGRDLPILSCTHDSWKNQFQDSGMNTIDSSILKSYRATEQ